MSLRAAALALLIGLTACQRATAPAPPPEKVLRYAFPAAETGFDPPQLADLYSRMVTGHIFEALYRYDYLARPFLVVPDTAAGLPEVSTDQRTWTIRLQPGIYFADDPAFKGRKRELVAEDYVYTFKRFFDPAVKSPLFNSYRQEGILGLEALRERALKSHRAFDYDTPVEGVRALDRYTILFRLAEPRPRFIFQLASSGACGAVAREVIEAYRGHEMEHPVGTGPFMLEQWRRSSFIRLVRNPGYRTVTYDAHPNADDAEGQAWLARFKGRRLPMIDAVEISIIEENQPRWLSFLNHEANLLYGIPEDFTPQAIPHGRLAPNLARRHFQAWRALASDRYMAYFNMKDPVVGGLDPAHVALRRAISLGVDVARQISGPRHGQAIPAQTVVAPFNFGYDPDFKTEASDFDPARANALLDLYGYLDRDGDGWREQPDGSPLVLELRSQPDSFYRQFEEIWLRDMTRLGIRLTVREAQWPENLKAVRAGQYMIWQAGYTNASPDAQIGLEQMYGPSIGGLNLARFKLPAYDALYDEVEALPDGPERLERLRRMLQLATAYAPMKLLVHRVVNDLAWPELTGFRRPAFGVQFWEYIDLTAPAAAAH